MSTPPAVPPTPAETAAESAEAIGNAARFAPMPEPDRVSGWFITLYTLTHFGFYLVLMMPALFSLAYKVQLIDPAGKEASLGLVVGTTSLVGLIAGPVAGALSDRTRLRWGRRRPYLVAGLVISLIGALVIAAAPTLPMVIVGGVIAQFAIACISAGLNPVVAEWVPESQRGKVGAFAGVASALAGVGASLVGSLLTGDLLLLFLLPVIVFAITVVPFVITVPDRPAQGDMTTESILGVFKDLLFDPRRYPDFTLVWIGKFAIQTGQALFSTYQLYFMLDRLGLTPEDAGRQLALVGGIGVLAMTSSAVIGGILSDRLRRRKAFIYVAAALVAAGLAIAAFASTILVYAFGAVILLLGTGAFAAVDVALCSDVLPEKETKAGKYMSIYYLAAGAPAAIAPVFAPLILMIGGGGNYTALFLVGSLCALGAVITTWRVHGAR